jgi:hypothetical protein
MIKNRGRHLVLIACVSCIGCGLIALPSSAAAKTKQAGFNQCVNAALAIPDGPAPGSMALNPAASFPIFVNVPKFKGRPQNGAVTAFNSAGVRISHSDDGDLALFLVSPGGRAVALATFRDQSTNKDPDTGDSSPSGDGYGSGAGSCSGSLVQFGDPFRIPIAAPGNTGLDAPITGSFKPEQPLSTFVGGPARGFWTLIAQDVQAHDIGQINAVSLSFTYSYKVKKKRKKRR